MTKLAAGIIFFALLMTRYKSFPLKYLRQKSLILILFCHFDNFFILKQSHNTLTNYYLQKQKRTAFPLSLIFSVLTQKMLR